MYAVLQKNWDDERRDIWQEKIRGLKQLNCLLFNTHFFLHFNLDLIQGFYPLRNEHQRNE